MEVGGDGESEFVHGFQVFDLREGEVVMNF